MTAYLDSSVVLDYVLEGGVTIHHVTGHPAVVSSELLEIECRRVLARARLEQHLGDEEVVEATTRLEAVLERTTLLAINEEVKRRAMGSFPLPIRTLDALHLATADIFIRNRQLNPTAGLIVWSMDLQMIRCARAMGLAVGGAP